MANDKNAHDWNKQIDQEIMSHGILDQPLLNKIVEAFAYDSVSTTTWAEKKLALFETRLQNGLNIQVFNTDDNNLQKVATIEEFTSWKKRHFRSFR